MPQRPRDVRRLDVRVLVRKGSHYYWLNDTGCAFFFGDLLDPVSQILGFYCLAEQMSLALGRDPDRPELLSKVTVTT